MNVTVEEALAALRALVDNPRPAMRSYMSPAEWNARYAGYEDAWNAASALLAKADHAHPVAFLTYSEEADDEFGAGWQIRARMACGARVANDYPTRGEALRRAAELGITDVIVFDGSETAHAPVGVR